MIDVKYCYYIHFGIRFCQAFDCGGAQMTHLQRVIRNEGSCETSFSLLSMNRNVDSYQEKGNNFHRKYMGWHGLDVEVRETNGTSNLSINAQRHV